MDFIKYQGTGNDFIIIDNRDNKFLTGNKTSLVKDLCNRKTGIGADGLIELRSSDKYDFKMVYYNSDGKEGTMCGNGGRCISAFAWHIKVADKNMIFDAVDGLHYANILDHNNNSVLVDLKMSDVSQFSIKKDHIIIDTGSPHYIKFVDNLDKIDVYKEGYKIRYSKDFSDTGINVNFVKELDDGLYVRTYERGVEDETLSCGTGVTASAIAANLKNIKYKNSDYPVITKGGNLKVRFKKNDKSFEDVWLKGEATMVFKGEILDI